MGKMPGSRIISGTYNQDLASDVGREVRDIVISERYQNVFPGIELRADSKAANRWQTSVGGYYISAGVGTSLTGRPGTFGIIDDPFKDSKEGDSELRQEEVWRWYTNVFMTRLSKDAPKIVINTRWNEYDLTGRILEKAAESGEKWHRINLPAINHEHTDHEEALWPEEKPLDFLANMRATMTARDWLAIYQQKPTADEGTFFKREWFNAYDTAPEHLNIYMSGDFAVTENGGDFTELGVWGVSPDRRIYLLDWWYGQTTADVWITEIVERIRFWRPLWFIGESGPIRRAIEPILRRRMLDDNALCALEWLPHSAANKEASARPFQALCSQGLVYWPQNPLAERVKDQLLRFPAGRYDDAVDTCSLFGRFIDQTWSKAKPPPPEKPLLIDKVELFVDDFYKPVDNAW